jgi:hypothetical protein
MFIMQKRVLVRNKFRFNDDWTVTIIINRKDGTVVETKVSFRDFYHKIAFVKCAWFVSNDGKGTYYVEGFVEGKRVYLHRYITDAPQGKVVHHVGHNPLVNTRDNLHVCTQTENAFYQKPNKTGVVGVCWHSRSKKIMVTINVDGKQRSYYFKPEELDEAIAFRRKLELEYFGFNSAIDHEKLAVFRQFLAEQAEGGAC